MPSGPPLTPPSRVPSLVLWVNSSLNRMMASFNAEASEASIVLKQGDSIGVEVHLLTSSSNGTIEEYQMPVAGGLTLAIGRIDATPTSGDFKLSYNAELTSVLPYNATASQLQTELNALPSIAAIGGVVVVKNGTLFRVIWNTQCVVPHDLTVNRNTLYPTSSIAISKVTDGSSSANQVLQLHVKQTPVANITNFEDQDPSVVYCDQLKDASFNGDIKIWRLDTPIKPKGGSFVISFVDGGNNFSTSPISVEASAYEVKLALVAKLNTSWEVTQNSKYSWDISVSRYTVSNLYINSSAVISFSAKYGNLNLNTIQVEELLSGNPSSIAILELELDSSGSKKTLYQGSCTIINDLIDSDLYTTVAWGDLIPADSVVRYDTSQSLTTPQKFQARTNIGAIDNASIAALQTKDTDLETRLSGVEAFSLDSNKLASINANTTLTGTNPVVSNSQLLTSLAGVPPLIHYHVISDVAGLRNEIDGKSDITHTHEYAQIIGLTNQLSLKINTTTAMSLFATISHTHNSFTNLTVDNLVVFGNITTPLLYSSQINNSGLINTSQINVGTNTSSTVSNIYGTLNVIANGALEGAVVCRNLTASDKVSANIIASDTFYSPLNNQTFTLLDVFQYYQHAPLTGSPPPQTSGDYIEVNIGGATQAAGGKRFRIPCYQIY